MKPYPLIPVVLAGGAGTRLWPQSRRAHPKPFMRLPDGETLLEKTLKRALGVSDAGLIVVTAKDQGFLAERELERCTADAKARFLLEPMGRNTAPAIALAALEAERMAQGPAVLLVLAADHLIADLSAFGADVRHAQALSSQGWLVTFGIVPSHPETGFGYLKLGAPLDGSARVVDAFVEKPDRATAQAYLDSGAYLWNSGMFCFLSTHLLQELATHAPDLLACARAVDQDRVERGHSVHYSAELFSQLTDISIDYAVMERAGQVAAVPATFDWSDIGSWRAVSELHARDADGNSQAHNILVFGSRNTVVMGGARLVAAIGVDDLLVIDTDDALLIAHRDHTQAVKQVVDHLNARGDARAHLHRTVQRPWGSYSVLEDGSDCKVKRLTVRPGQVLSLQLHHQRSEHWTVVTGTARVTIAEETFDLPAGRACFIPVNTKHRLENQTDSDIHLIEVQVGSYFGEDDIVRFEDRYGRV